MSYVQGTVIVITMSFTDPDTGNLSDPPDVQVTVWAPGATSATTYTFLHGDVAKLSTGKYRYLLDTSSAAGAWRYEAVGTGPEAIVRQRVLRILPRYAAAA